MKIVDALAIIFVKVGFYLRHLFSVGGIIVDQQLGAGDAITSTMIIIGEVMGVVIVPAVNLCYLVVLFVKRRISVYVPLWLVIANILFLFILLFYIFYLNDPYYHQK